MVRKKAYSFTKKLRHWHTYDRLSFFASLLIAGTLVIFLGLMFVKLFFDESYVTEKVLGMNLSSLQEIFKKIDDDCKIIEFEIEKTPINFLTVSSFAGSEVGSMRVVHPDKWKGPYAEKNPTINGKYYYIYKTAHGYYIGPDSGIKIAHKKIGKDIIVDKNTNIDELLKNDPSLTIKGRPLFVPIGTSKHKLPYTEHVLETD